MEILPLGWLRPSVEEDTLFLDERQKWQTQTKIKEAAMGKITNKYSFIFSTAAKRSNFNLMFKSKDVKFQNTSYLFLTTVF